MSTHGFTKEKTQKLETKNQLDSPRFGFVKNNNNNNSSSKWRLTLQPYKHRLRNSASSEENLINVTKCPLDGRQRKRRRNNTKIRNEFILNSTGLKKNYVLP